MRQESSCFLLISAASLPTNVLAEQLFEIEIEELIILLRFAIGIAFVIFGVFFLLYKDCATKIFLKRYDEGNPIVGLVVACDETGNTNGRKYLVQVVYSAPNPKAAPQGRHKKEASTTATGPLLQQEYMHRFKSNWLAPQGTILDLYIIPGMPKSAVTKDLLDSKKENFSWSNSLSVLIPGLGLAAIFLGLTIDVLGDFPPDRQWVGWVIVAAFAGVSILVSWALCDNQFQYYARTTFLSSSAVQRRDSHGNIVPPPQAMPESHAVPESQDAAEAATPAGDVIPGVEPCLSNITANTGTSLTSSLSRKADPEGVYAPATIV